jgi:hypothetical protein
MSATSRCSENILNWTRNDDGKNLIFLPNNHLTMPLPGKSHTTGQGFSKLQILQFQTTGIVMVDAPTG